MIQKEKRRMSHLHSNEQIYFFGKGVVKFLFPCNFQDIENPVNFEDVFFYEPHYQSHIS